MALRGEFRREKCNMLQESLAGMVLRVNVGKKKANLEEICSICYIISCIITLISVDSLLKLILKKKFFSTIFYKKSLQKTRQPQSVCGLQCFLKNNIVKLLVYVRTLLNANGSAMIKSVL